jgi:hypothetical protein
LSSTNFVYRISGMGMFTLAAVPAGALRVAAGCACATTEIGLTVMNAMTTNPVSTRFLTDVDDNVSIFFKVTSAKHRLGLGQCRTTLYTMTRRVVTLTRLILGAALPARCNQRMVRIAVLAAEAKVSGGCSRYSLV